MATLTLQPDAAGIDTHVYEASADSNYAAWDAFEIRQFGTSRAFALLKFDMGGIPAGSIINGATLYLYGSGGSYDDTLTLYRILAADSAWTEAATWNYADGASVRWAGDAAGNGGTDAGCSVSGTDYSGTAIGAAAFAKTLNAETAFVLDLTEFRLMVAANHGLRINRANGLNPVRPCTSDHATAANRPSSSSTTRRRQQAWYARRPGGGGSMGRAGMRWYHGIALALLFALAGCVPLPTPQPVTPTATPPPTTLILPIAELFERVDALETRVTLLEATPVVTPTLTPAPPTVTPTTRPSQTPTPITPTPTPPPAPSVVTGRPGGYGQYDWPCPSPLEPGKLASGQTMLLCPSGLNYATDPATYKNINAFREEGGMNWPKASAALATSYLALGGQLWVSWADINPTQGVYNWSVIDAFIDAAKSISMESGAQLGPPKGVLVKLYDMESNVPALTAPGTAFDDLTPAWVKDLVGGSHKLQMPACSPAVWNVPRYNDATWRQLAAQMLRDVAAHYDKANVTFNLGLGGLDGEWGNFLPESFAGCKGLRTAFQQQFGLGAGQMVWQQMARSWVAGSTAPAYVSCTAFCSTGWFVDLPSLGLYQARAVADGPDYHRASGVGGVMDDALLFVQKGRAVAWESAAGNADPTYLYKMLSLVSMTWPKLFAYVGGSWDGNKMLIREFNDTWGETPETATKLWWRSYVTCYLPGNPACPQDGYSIGDWHFYQGWPSDIARGISTTAQLAPVDQWTLTDIQRTATWASMLRMVTGTVTFNVDPAWQQYQAAGHTVILKILDTGLGDVSIGYTAVQGAEVTVTLPRLGNGAYNALQYSITNVDLSKGLRVSAQGAPLYLHGVEIVRR